MDTPGSPTSPLLRRALDYWTRLRGSRAMPSRADLNPLDIPDLLPFVMLIDVLDDPRDFRFRLLGTEHDQIVSGDYRGRSFSELPHTAPGNPVWDQYERGVALRRPLCFDVPYVGGDPYVTRHIESCLMPHSADGVTVNMILVVAAIDGR